MGKFSGLHGVAAMFGVFAAMVACVAASQGVHHLVGGDEGWGADSDAAEWPSGKGFRVGDNIRFAHSIARDTIVELESREDFESCNISNPIRMYGSKLDRVSLDSEGARYFASSKLDNCKNGLKFYVNVLPRAEEGKNVELEMQSYSSQALAAWPKPWPKPSGSAKVDVSVKMLVLALVCLIVF